MKWPLPRNRLCSVDGRPSLSGKKKEGSEGLEGCQDTALLSQARWVFSTMPAFVEIRDAVIPAVTSVSFKRGSCGFYWVTLAVFDGTAQRSRLRGA